MDDDIPEREILNLEETVTCARVSMRYLCRSAGRAAASFRALGDATQAFTKAIEDVNESLGEFNHE
jgi:hypothetical protein